MDVLMPIKRLKKGNMIRRKKKKSRYKSSKNYKYKTWTLDLDPKNMPKPDDITYIFPYDEELQGFDFSSFDPCRNITILSGEDMLLLKDELEKLGDLYTMNFGAGVLTYSLIVVLSLILCVAANFWVDSFNIEGEESLLLVKIGVFLSVFVLGVSVMALCFKRTEKLMKKRHKVLKKVE